MAVPPFQCQVGRPSVTVGRPGTDWRLTGTGERPRPRANRERTPRPRPRTNRGRGRGRGPGCPRPVLRARRFSGARLLFLKQACVHPAPSLRRPRPAPGRRLKGPVSQGSAHQKASIPRPIMRGASFPYGAAGSSGPCVPKADALGPLAVHRWPHAIGSHPKSARCFLPVTTVSSPGHSLSGSFDHGQSLCQSLCQWHCTASVWGHCGPVPSEVAGHSLHALSMVLYI